MELPTNKPRVFVSSTIRDLRDLRSAMKYWLEELGLDVRMSEFNDFVRRPEQGTFESCFAAIADCHYFVLLVGGRKGTEYRDGVSVTQQEYRVAAELARRGRIAPVVLVRGEVLTALGERKASRNAAIAPAADGVEKSRVLDDPAFVERFVEEIGQTEVGREGKDPSGGMWIYRFDDFRDIADALRNTLHLIGSIPRRTLLANLAWELKENVSVLCGKRGPLPFCSHAWLSRLRRDLRLGNDDFARPVLLDPDQAHRLELFLVLGAPDEHRLRKAALEDAISSREFLVYRQDSGSLAPSQELEVMYVLLGEIERYGSVRGWLRTRQTELLAELESARIERRSAHVVGHELGLILALHDITQNILRLIDALLDHATDSSAPLRMPDLVPTTPFGESIERIREEQPTHEDIDRWRENRLIRDFMTGQQEASLADVEDAVGRYPRLAESLRLSSEELRFYSGLFQEFERRLASEGREPATAHFMEQIEARVRQPRAGNTS